MHPDRNLEWKGRCVRGWPQKSLDHTSRSFVDCGYLLKKRSMFETSARLSEQVDQFLLLGGGAEEF